MNVRNFLDAETEKAGYSVFKWDEWCFIINRCVDHLCARISPMIIMQCGSPYVLIWCLLSCQKCVAMHDGYICTVMHAGYSKTAEWQWCLLCRYYLF